MSVLWEMPLPESAQAHLQTARELNVSHFAPLAAFIDAEQRYPWETVALLVDSGLSGLMVPREYGGAGESLLTACAVLEELSRACASTSGILSIHLMGGLPIESFGTPEQRSTYLPEILSGRAISFSLTERGAGSDPSHMRSTATRLPDGAWRLRGEKIYVGNGGSSSHYVVFVRTADSASTGAGLTAFLVSLTDDGVSVDRYADKMGLRGTTTSNLKLAVDLPPERVVGAVGHGLQIAMSVLNRGRCMMAAHALGVAVAAFEHACTESARQSAAGGVAADRQGITFRLADVATRINASRMLLWQAAQAPDQERSTRSLASMAKLFATETTRQAVDLAMDLFGNAGLSAANPIERLYRDQRIMEIHEGTSEIQRLTIAKAIARDQRDGALRPLQPAG